MCKELCLVIEVDGLTHLSEVVIEKDKLKQDDLEKAGFIVLRFRDEEVLNHIDLVTNEIENAIRKKDQYSPPPLIPPPAGDT